VATTLQQQIDLVRGEFSSRPAGLLRHVERVLVEACDLAVRWDLDADRVELATWGHDLFRAHSPAEQLRLARDAGLPLDPVDEADPVLLHGPLAAVVLRERFAVTDNDVLDAVRDHTLGSPAMPLIAKVILVADKVEARKRKRTPLMRDIRRLARRDLDLALLCWADWKWVEERRRGWASHPTHWHAREAWVRAHHVELGLPPRTEDEPTGL
jgi:predicted HD superfamily hydrolase involved in NAD metabolism